jgi:predicted nuclease of restriction endonuclease-like (RecB) superfamily
VGFRISLPLGVRVCQIEFLKIEDELERNFYITQALQENWGVRELKRQIKSSLFHRLALSRDKAGILKLSQKGQVIERPEDIIREPVILEFLRIPENKRLLESELEQKLIDNLQTFLMELGKGFAFIGRQYRIPIAGRNFRADLVFYHRILKCFVLIDLKRGEVTHEDIGQMNLYLNYFKKEENVEGDNEPFGIILGASKDDVFVEYALNSIQNSIFVNRYQLYLPDREVLENELRKLLADSIDKVSE